MGPTPTMNITTNEADDEVNDRDKRPDASHKIALNDKENTGSNVIRRGLEDGHKVYSGDGISVNSTSFLEPNAGMEFESKEEAFSFYKEYARTVGFATIIKASRRSRISGKFIDAKFVCIRYGPKQESTSAELSQLVKKKRGRASRSWSKTDCKASLHVKRRQDGRWIICSFIKEHNHEMFPDQAHFLRGHRKNKVDAKKSRQSSGYKKLGNLKYSQIEQFGDRQHSTLEEGDVQVMLDHFMCMQGENPNFFYAIDLNQEQRLRNVFWVDAKGRLDYSDFNDVVFFDTTYINDEYKLPFCPFRGVNHHFQFLLLGYAIIANKTKSTFVWLMKAWLRAMGGLAPRVILTDQDQALKDAIAEVLPDSQHCFCLWHILSKIPEKLSYVMDQHGDFMTKFKKCIFRSWTDEKFKKRWLKILFKYDLNREVCLQSLYEDRQRWAPTYMRDVFMAGMSTARRSDHISSLYEKCIQRKTTLREFLDQYKLVLREKYEEEAKANFESWHKQPVLISPSPFEKQMARIYTHTIFKKFQLQVLGVVACHPKRESEDGTTITYRVQDFEENQDFLVAWCEAASNISCSCHLFEYNGFLCRHAMIVLQISGVHNIPSQYILKRWTKDAKSRHIVTQGSETVTSRVQWYNDLCQRAYKLGDEGSLSLESYNIAFKALEEVLRKCENANSSTNNLSMPGLPLTRGFYEFEELNQDNDTTKSDKIHLEPQVMTTGMHESWQQMGQSSFMSPSRDYRYGNQGMHELEQLHFRAQNTRSCFDLHNSLEDMDQSSLGS